MMLKFSSALKIIFLLAFCLSGITHSQQVSPQVMVSPQCWPAYADYSNCQQIGSSATGAGIAFCKKANENWVSSGCAAQSQPGNNQVPCGMSLITGQTTYVNSVEECQQIMASSAAANKAAQARRAAVYNCINFNQNNWVKVYGPPGPGVPVYEPWAASTQYWCEQNPSYNLLGN
jgi:hypothetical protein